MTETGTSEAVTGYLTSLRAALADLPPAEVEEILDDVGPHVAEVAAELAAEDPDADLGQRLRERLGGPEQYAAELRAAAGYPPRADAAAQGGARPGLGWLRTALWLLVASTVLVALTAMAWGPSLFGNLPGFLQFLLLAGLPAALSLVIALRHPGGIAALAELPEVRRLRARTPGGAVAEYGRLLQPGWWLVRAGIAALLAVAVLRMVPEWLVLLLAVPMILGSVWLGRRSKADRRWLWAVLPLNAFAVVVGLILLDLLPGARVSYVDVGDGAAVPVPVPAFGNVYPYDADGTPLTGVYLYDERGLPIVAPYSADECRPANRVPVPANQYPQPGYEVDLRSGECVLRSSPPTPPQLPTASVTPTPAPSPSSAPPATTVPPPSGVTPTS